MSRSRERDVGGRAPGPSTGDILLRDVAEGDLPIFFQHQLDPEATRMAAFTSRDWDAFTAHWRTRILGDETVIAKAVLLDGRVAGNVVSFERSGKREVGYWIGREHWGKGVAATALMQFLRHVKARPLYAHVAKHNVASLRVLEKCGFTISREEEGSSSSGDDEVEEWLLKLEA